MANKQLESIIRDLQKTILGLGKKIDSLEEKIEEQSKIISTLPTPNKQCEKCSSSAPDQVTAAVTKQPAAALQRSERAERRNRLTALEKTSSATPRKSSATSDELETPTQDVNKIPENVNLPTKITTIPLNSGTKSPAKEMKAKSVPNAAKESQPRTIIQQNQRKSEWEVVGPKRRKKQPVVVVGTGNSDHELRAVERIRYIQAWYFEPNTTTEKIELFLNKIVKANFTVERRKIRTDRHAAFMISMPCSVYEQVTTPDVWPPGVRFAEWFPGRPREPRGSTGE